MRYGSDGERMPAIRVERQVQYVDGVLEFLPPKYESYRTLVIPPFLAELLEQLLASHGSRWVFPAKLGGSLGAVNFDYTYWRPIADGAEERKGPRVRRPRPAISAVPAVRGEAAVSAAARCEGVAGRGRAQQVRGGVADGS